jgi:mono/diheme cytochrome c family protein
MKRSLCIFMGLVFMVVLIPVKAFAEEGDAIKGRDLYFKHCKICHGPEGKGDGYTQFNPPVADLTVSRIQEKSDKELWESIHMGISNSAMGMWRFVLSDKEITLVLAHVRALAAGS